MEGWNFLYVLLFFYGCFEKHIKNGPVVYCKMLVFNVVGLKFFCSFTSLSLT